MSKTIAGVYPIKRPIQFVRDNFKMGYTFNLAYNKIIIYESFSYDSYSSISETPEEAIKEARERYKMFSVSKIKDIEYRMLPDEVQVLCLDDLRVWMVLHNSNCLIAKQIHVKLEGYIIEFSNRSYKHSARAYYSFKLPGFDTIHISLVKNTSPEAYGIPCALPESNFNSNGKIYLLKDEQSARKLAKTIHDSMIIDY